MLDCFIKNYSYHRIKQIFRDDYGLTLQRIYTYKGTRYGKPIRYNLVTEDGTIELANVTLKALRQHLTAEDYPLKQN